MSGQSEYLPADASIPDRLRAAMKAFQRLTKVQDDPVAATLIKASLDSDIFQREAKRMAATEEGRALLAEQPAIHRGNIDLGQLSRLAEGTVGRAFARYYEDNGILPFESPYAVRTDADYLMKWYRETHDLHHVVTGYGTDSVGEMELQAFVLGNLRFRHCLFIVAVSTILNRKNLSPLGPYLRRVVAAYQRGQRTRNLFSVRYERYFEQTVEKLRADLAVPA
jgi:ubiquinone biosynthesis protein COQ4